MRENKSILQRSIISLFIFVFIVAYFLFLTHIYIKPRNFFDRMPFLLYIGFAIIIIVYFSFFLSETNGNNNILFKFKCFSENSIKLILIIFMSTTIFIPPISFTTTVIDWNQVGFFNYFRAISFLIGCLFLPGANLFKIFFHKNTLHKRFKVEPFIIKITLYPLLSLIFLGLSVLILDQIGFLRESITIILFLLILGLVFSDLIIQKLRNNKIEMNITEINISKYTFMILIAALGILLISLGIQINAKYLVGSDSWCGIGSAKNIGSLNPSPVESRYTYAIFWGYHSFGLSILSGLPYININVMLTPFCYLSVISIYLFIKAILYDYKEKYSVLASILIITFSSLFYFSPNLELGYTSALIADFVFYFRYKSYAYFLLFSSLALFFIISKTNNTLNLKTKHMLKTEEFKIIILGALFLVMSFMIYFIPLLAGFFLILLYCLFSDKKKKIRIFFHFISVLFIFYILFDILTNFTLSEICSQAFSSFFGFFLYLRDIPKNIMAFLIYSVLGSVFIFYVIFQRLYNKYFHTKKKSKYRKKNFHKKFFKSKILARIKINPKIIFMLLLTIFSVFLILEICNIILEKFFLDYKLVDKDFLAFYLDKIFLNIGFIGILAVYLTYFCFKKNKQLFYVLISWILFSFGLASILIFKGFILDYPFISPQDIPEDDFYYMNFWFNRIWFYSIPALSILSSIGLVLVAKKLKNNMHLMKRKNLRKIFNLSSVSILIVLSFSSLIMGGMFWACNYKSGYSGYSDSEAQIVGWVSENVPYRSNISIDNSFLSRNKGKKDMLEYMTDCKAYYINDLIEEALQEKNYWHWEFINESDSNCIFLIQLVINYLERENIRYIILSEETLSNNQAEKINIQNDLISKFFNKKLYEYQGFAVYYALI